MPYRLELEQVAVSQWAENLRRLNIGCELLYASPRPSLPWLHCLTAGNILKFFILLLRFSQTDAVSLRCGAGII
jgi:hypothetical protein